MFGGVARLNKPDFITVSCNLVVMGAAVFAIQAEAVLDDVADVYRLAEFVQDSGMYIHEFQYTLADIDNFHSLFQLKHAY